MRAGAALQTGTKNPVSAAPLPRATEKAPAQAIESQESAVAGPGHNFGAINVHSGHSFSASPIRIQPKLTINQPGDVYEQEADAVADRVMRMPDAPPKLSGKLGSAIQRKEHVAGLAVSPSTASYVSSLSGGKPLSRSELSFFEPRIGHDLSRVQLHTNGRAAESASGINALAYAYGNHIVFGAGQYQPETETGKRLLAHELTHTIQESDAILPYRKKKDFNFGKGDDGVLIEDSFNIGKDKETKPWIELITVEFTSQQTDINGDNYWTGTASVQYYNNSVKMPDFVFPIAGGSVTLGRTDKGNFTVHRIEGIGYNSGSFSGTPGVDYSKSDREGPKKRYSKARNGNMNFAVFYNKGEALHAGPLDESSHGCVHVDWGDEGTIRQVNYHSVIKLTKVKVKY